MKRLITLRSLLGVMVLGSLGGVAVLLWIALAPEKTSPPPKPEVAADLKLDRVHYLETREGVKEWELEAVSAVYFKDENSVRPGERSARCFTEKGRKAMCSSGRRENTTPRRK